MPRPCRRRKGDSRSLIVAVVTRSINNLLPQGYSGPSNCRPGLCGIGVLEAPTSARVVGLFIQCTRGQALLLPGQEHSGLPSELDD